jgi:hypothetical protein
MSAIIDFVKGTKTHPSLSCDELGFRYAWLEGRSSAVLAWFEKTEAEWRDLNLWPGGRLFGPSGEYRWRKDSTGCLHAVVIMDSGTLPQGFGGMRPLPIKRVDEDSRLILWGEWVDPAKDRAGNPDGGPKFYAGEIPGVLTYPLNGGTPFLFEGARTGKAPRLVVRRYRIDPSSGEPAGRGGDPKTAELPGGEFVRCLGLELSQ